MPHFSHSDYYRDRNSESELCHDFPGDATLIRGLYAMQSHMWSNGVNIDIPVLRVMNPAHFLAAYMFATTCSGDQTEYDALANMTLGRDKQLFKVAVIVLAAMLKRTDGFRARQCRNMLLDNRDNDFDEGVNLYDRFLRNAEAHFAEEDFLIDTHTQIQRLQAENEQLTIENAQLKNQYRIMEQKYTQNNQYNHCVIYNAPVYNTNTTNNYYSGPSVQEPQAAAYTPTDKPQTALYPFVMPEKLKELGTCTMADFENKYREAVKSGANVLAPFLVRYRDLHVLDLGKRTKKDIYEVLKAFFGDDLKFGYPNFAAYY